MDVISKTESSIDPLDVVEQVVASEQYAYERSEDGEIHFAVRGSWQDHSVWFAWSDGIETLHICLALEAKIPQERRREVAELLNLLNERLWLGHFDVWSDDAAIVYRNALPLPGEVAPAPGQIAAMIAAAIEAGERFYPAFNFLIWGGRGPVDAVAAALFETAGEA